MIPNLDTAARFAGNHLWQSTLTAGAALALAALLRKGEARLRHGIWMAASLKFFVPFALLVELGRRVATPHIAHDAAEPLLATVLAIGQPFAQLNGTHPAAQAQAAQAHVPWILLLALFWAAGALTVLIVWMIRWRRVRAVVRNGVPQHSGREAETLRTAQRAASIRRPIPLLLSHDSMEPGVCGIIRPALLWPAGISAHLEDEQLAAIFAHEVWHVRRRDNLLAFLHMCVEAVFWFHPLVWWMGARLMEERERACDEAVLRLGNEPARYADAILKACRFCVESPLACISGVSGSDLKQRMVRIMNAATVPLSRSRKLLLAAVAMAAIAGPIAVGVLHPPVVQADEAQQFANLRFDSVSLTPIQSADQTFFILQHDGQFTDLNITMKELIAMAYGVKPDRILGGPDWINTQHFKFEARWTPTPETTSKIPVPDAPRTETQVAVDTAAIGAAGHVPEFPHIPASGALQAMLRNFLVEHVALKVRDDSAVLPVYELVVANGGSKLTPTHEPQESPGVTGVRMKTRVEARNINGNQSYSITNGDPHILCENLTNQLGHQVIDKTGLTGRYDFELAFPAHADADQLATILRDQFGLDLQSTQQPTRVYAVDSVNLPQTN